MNHNLLLTYLSELGEGDWSTFRKAVNFLNADDEFYPSLIARRLGLLGHVEFAFDDNNMRWALCPPTLAWLPDHDRLVGVLCGARSQRLLDDIQRLAGDGRVTIESQRQEEGPDIIYIIAPTHKVGQEFANQLGLICEFPTSLDYSNAALRIARCLPPLIEYEPLFTEAPEPVGFTIRSFDIDKLEWLEVERAEQSGLYWYYYYRPEYRLKSAGNDARTEKANDALPYEGNDALPYEGNDALTSSVRAASKGRCLKVNRHLGIYLLLQRHKRIVLHYDAALQTLSVPVRAPLPLLYARALTLASGRLPQYIWHNNRPTYVYGDVPPALAQMILVKLRQEKGEYDE